MKNAKTKRILSMISVCILILAFGLFALGSSDEDNNVVTQQGGKVEENNIVTQRDENVEKETTDNSILGDYSIEIKSCRLAKDYEGKSTVIVTYNFTNVSDNDPAAFYTSIEDQVYQDGVGLNKSYFIDDSYKYNSDNTTKEIKKGASIEVEVAYELNDTSTPIDVEVSEWLSWDDKTITKQFELN